MTAARDQHGVWERIADSFDRSRTRRWPHVEAFVRALPPGSRVLDLMGGNGRHLASIKEAGHRGTWLDWSRPAARIVGRRHADAAVVVGDAVRLPFPAGCFDACVFVAGLHSLPTQVARLACLDEMARVLRPAAPAQVTVWSRDAPRFRSTGTPGEPIDVNIPWRSHGHDEDRHYHLYTAQALRADLEASGLRVDSVQPVAVVAKETDNLVATVHKPA